MGFPRNNPSIRYKGHTTEELLDRLAHEGHLLNSMCLKAEITSRVVDRLKVLGLGHVYLQACKAYRRHSNNLFD